MGLPALARPYDLDDDAAKKQWRSYSVVRPAAVKPLERRELFIQSGFQAWAERALPYEVARPRAPEADGPRAPLERETRALRQLPKGWDGYGGERPQEGAVQDALAFIPFMNDAWRDPVISVASNGNFSFYWKNDTSVIDLEFDGSGSIAAYISDADGRVLLSEIVPISREAIGPALAELMGIFLN